MNIPSQRQDDYDSFDPSQPARLPKSLHDQIEKLRDMGYDLEQENELMKAANLEGKIQRKTASKFISSMRTSLNNSHSTSNPTTAF